mgnify:CR=1 FL=1
MRQSTAALRTALMSGVVSQRQGRQSTGCEVPHLTSHFDWRNGHQIFAWARWREVGDRYFLMEDRDIAETEGGNPVAAGNDEIAKLMN